MLSALTVDQIAAAVAEDDDKPFRRVSGIGPKTAKLIVVQLQGKLAPPAPAASPSAAPTDVADRVAQAVAGLGWPERVAGEAVAQAAQTASESDRASVQTLLRLTLALLGPAAQGATRG